MALTNFRTTSRPDFQDLDGFMSMDGNNVIGYTSKNAGPAEIHMFDGPNLHFKVTFAHIKKPYIIKADGNVAGNGYVGNASEENAHKKAGTADTWTATDTGPKPHPHGPGTKGGYSSS
ncbi:MAG: hypothetical protein QOH70_3843 [Blastocatellia bacterium]|jgi:hypothetical protein|nr:hypothetical protein [Blastocatellia bacterium]